MKTTFATILATLAASTLAAPTPTTGLGSLAGLTDIVGDLTKIQGLDGIADVLKLGDVTKELDLENLPVVSSVGDLSKLLKVPSSSAASSTPAVQDGHIVQNLGPQLNNVLTITGTDLKPLLIELSPEVTTLVSSLGLGALGVPLGSIVASASELGDLVTGLGPYVDGLVTVVGADVGALLVSLSPEVAALVSGLGLPTVGVPVGEVLATVGTSLKKRNQIVGDLAPEVKEILTVTGPNAKQLLIKLSPEVASLVSGLGLPSVGVPAGEVVKTAANVGDLLVDISGPVENLLKVVNKDGSALLIQLSPEVASLVAGLGLSATGASIGSVVATVGQNL
ncbi:hypothetical protein N7466_004448 [Penicillium verhagenii]|uniref:uncharacterized protein n=1 Tax=Penicillium verhagenii TaxID=1562060 RepID=UPI002545B65E|nr:uncharacterized protein N7466_004448 [Penicillium verhagenii]KAJ5934901.1 hypothetical protein N7466_004448 [Penicillium verhagenii]